jgi:hypothetical protein
MKKLLFIVVIVSCLAFSGRPGLSFSKELGNFRIDTVKVDDAKRGLTVMVTVPVANVYAFDTLVRSALMKDEEGFVAEVDERYEVDSTDTGFDYSALLVSAYRSKKIISYNFLCSHYFNTAVHGMSVYRSFTYDLDQKRLVTFDDYFALRTKKDTLAFIDLLTKRVNEPGASVETVEGLHFHFTQDSITFNFDDYEIASYAQGLLQAAFSLKELKRYLRK